MDCISTGLALIDELLGGGLPRGHIVELLGTPSSGKTTLALNWVAAAQRDGLTAVWIDADRTFDASWAAKAGVSAAELVVARPDSGTQAAGILDHLLRTFSVDLIIVDSAAALADSNELESSPEDLPADLGNGFLARMLRRSRAVLDRSGAVITFLSPQYPRDKQDLAGYTPGGRVLSQYSAIRLTVRSKAAVINQGSCAGHRLSLVAIKNKLADPFQEALVDLDGAVLRAPTRFPMGSAAPATRRAGTAS